MKHWNKKNAYLVNLFVVLLGDQGKFELNSGSKEVACLFRVNSTFFYHYFTFYLQIQWYSMPFWELGRTFITDQASILHDMMGFYFHGLLKRYFSHFKSRNWHTYLSCLKFDDGEIIFYKKQYLHVTKTDEKIWEKFFRIHLFLIYLLIF